jgi:hypothetical protein
MRKVISPRLIIVLTLILALFITGLCHGDSSREGVIAALASALAAAINWTPFTEGRPVRRRSRSGCRKR